MTKLTHLLATPIIETLGLTLVHFLWQGTVVALVFAVLLHFLKDSSASTRYRTACMGLVLMSILPIATYTYLYPTLESGIQSVDIQSQLTPPPSPALATDTASAPIEPGTLQSATSSRPGMPFADVQSIKVGNLINSIPLKTYLPWFVAIWLLGVIGLSIRLIGGLFLTYQLRTKATKPVPAALEASLQTVLKKLDIRQQVKLRESLAVTVPVVIGWLRPVVLLPTSVITGLSQQQLELILAHELAHVRRHDYLINILQKVVETLLFYHPAVGWLSNVIRQEREHCCDDLVVSLYREERVSYAHTLSQLETMRSSQRLILAANDGSLVKRIQRLAGKPQTATYPTAGVFGLLPMLIIALVFSLATAQATLPVEIEQNIDAFMENRLEAWGGAPGAQVAIIQDGETAFNRAYGLADVETGREMTVDTPVVLGPNGGYIFTRLALLQLAEVGQLEADDTVSDILPWVRFQEGEENTITLEDLASGIVNIVDATYPGGFDLYSETEKPGNLDSDIETAEDYIRSLTPDDLVTSPDWLDTSLTGDLLLVVMIEELSGLSFQDYMEQNVFEPLNIEASYVLEAQQITLATSYKDGPMTAPGLEAVDIAIPPPFKSALGLSMSSRDMATFVEAVIARDPQLLSEVSWERFAPSTVEDPPGDWDGIFRVFGGSSGSETVMEINPSLRTGYVAMTNYNGDPLYTTLALDIVESVGTSLELLKENSSIFLSSTKEDGFGTVSANTLANDSGSYLSALGPIEIFEEEGELHGTLLGHDFRLDKSTVSYIIDSDYEPINDLILNINTGRIAINGKSLAFKVE